ncbi:MAG TPA: aldehyde dehydrogenase family protein, partial [Terrimesophilobacter sp.]|nr:aldehyde dehydrogenase family protein [Terrimesophilobacter sp.]
MVEFPQPPHVIDELLADLSATSGEEQPVNAPFTGTTLCTLPLSSLDDVADAANKARLAQLAWWEAGFAHRRRVLLRAHDLMLARQELILDLIQAETGKARLHAFEDFAMGVYATRYNALSAKPVLRRTSRRAMLPVLYRT